MSEKQLSEQQAPSSAEQTPVPAKPSGGKGLAAFALLVAAVGVAVAGWGVWQLHTLTQSHQRQSSQIETLSIQSQTLKQSEQQLDQRLAQFPLPQELEERRQLVAQLQGDQQRISQRLETVLGSSRQGWRLAEAEHLLRLAALRLSALQDITSATALVEGADQILREQDDPAAFATREQLARSLAALNSVDQPDRTGLFLQLGALRDQAAQLSALAPAFQAQEQGQPVQAADDGWMHWRKYWQRISGFFRVDFNPDDNLRPLLAEQGLGQVRMALSLALEQAQWGALNGQQAVYQQAMKQAGDILGAAFNQENVQARNLSAQLAKLAKAPVQVQTPDLGPSIKALQAYLAQRQAPEPSTQREAKP
ncbi:MULTISPECIES: uroporphyrinogen-III C-methyltransferase [unclassified Pseudomonas]|uniref:uroporphyrinogen-III C-methyltransferase n=1 Tax=unclassified Pseudomonas TaxID=196821 RepID=UPI000BD38F71|nr:uroporphyrin-3 C-methyltransferase [Pseudomonas sp. URIL14HWK12:I12]PVZ21840.1 uroporphyrin-3 C-methyltransferase [Pseudomonas sp. URIL14HWK12:I10]PVZ31077.1 uroporphyrin-3 C-methyltransferase [Pseudomonas sp. URIL14HWK12:I11]SNZ17706.1 uroporphyrin-3 C-methyltransferase [Pseudomonas sp. URIL14HWK12:I9]